VRRGERLRIVVGGAFGRVPGQGGLAWMVLHYVLGLRRLGHQVVLVEPLDEAEIRPAGSPLASSDNVRFVLEAAAAFGLAGAVAVRGSGGTAAGIERGDLERYVEGCDLLLDLAGGLASWDAVARIPVRVYLDLDPGFTQLWQEISGIDMRFAGHTHFATVGLTLDRPGRRVPTCGIDWIPTPPPVVLEHWPYAEQVERPALTTVANWRGYGSIESDGRLFGQKAHSLRRFIDLPRRRGERFELALAIDPGEPADLAALAENGWELVDPRAVAATPEAYRRFVSGSRGELGVAKSGYVEGRCGWFSDRSVCYLAAGRPVVAQETGFSEALPVGAGLFAWETAGELDQALEELARDYEGNRHAARALAEEIFDSDVVLGRLLSRVGVAA
jgi:hypothetical protein